MNGQSVVEKHLRRQLDELQRRYNSPTEHVAALDTDIGRELDSEHKLVLEERRAEDEIPESRALLDGDLRQGTVPAP